MSVKGMRFVCLKSENIQPIKGSWDTIQEAVAAHFNGKQAGAFVMMYHRTWLGIYKNGEFSVPFSAPLNPAYLRFARIFDDDSECYVWKNGEDPANTYRLRIRQDEEEDNEQPNAVEARQLLWGTRLENSPAGKQWKLLKEKRGIELIIHESLLPDNIHVSAEKRLWLIARNYINYTDLGQAGYMDNRFVRIIGEGGKMDEEGNH